MAVSQKPHAPAAINGALFPHIETPRSPSSDSDRSTEAEEAAERNRGPADDDEAADPAAVPRRRLRLAVVSVVEQAARREREDEGVPEGHVPVYVGEERFLVRAELLGAPAMAELLGRAAQEYRYRHQGPIRIPCPVAVFRRALASVAGDDEEEDDGE